MNTIEVEGKPIGKGHPCFITAEIGINHNGDFERAQEMIEVAASCGVDAVKFQNYRTEDFLTDQSLTYTYEGRDGQVTESQWEIFKRCEMDPDWIPRLRQVARDNGVVFFSTPTGESGVDELVANDVQLLKNGSDYLTHTPLLEYMAQTGLPLVISTGMANRIDVRRALDAVERGGDPPMVVLHCTSTYPTSLENTNLRRMNSLEDQFEELVGFSDHTRGFEAAVQAVSMGACFIEKHFTLSRDLPGPDHRFSSAPEEMERLVDEVRRAEQRLGSAEIQPAQSEQPSRDDYRVSVVASRDLSAGEELTEDMVSFRRPGTGLHPDELPDYLGATLTTKVPRGEPVTTESFSD